MSIKENLPKLPATIFFYDFFPYLVSVIYRQISVIISTLLSDKFPVSAPRVLYYLMLTDRQISPFIIKFFSRVYKYFFINVSAFLIRDFRPVKGRLTLLDLIDDFVYKTMGYKMNKRNIEVKRTGFPRVYFN